MEQPKVRFTKINNGRAGEPLSLLSPPSYAMYAKNEKISTCQKKCLTGNDKIKIKSIVPVKFPVKVLKSGNVLIHNVESQSFGSWFNGKVPQTNYTSLIKPSNGDAEIVHLAQVPQSPLDSHVECLPSISDSDTSTNRLFVESQCLKDNKINYSQQLKSCTDDLQTNSKTKLSVDVPLKTENKTSYDCISINNEDDDNGIQILKVVHNSKKLPWYNKQSNDKKCYNVLESCDNYKISMNTINKDKLDKTTKENKENYSEKLLSNKVANTLSNVVSSILKDSTNAYSTCFKSVKNSKKCNNKIITVMPCANFRIPSLTKNQVLRPQTQISKEILLNVAADKYNISVQPKSSLKNLQYKTNNDYSFTGSRKKIISKDILFCPEYNSTVNVIKKFKDIKNKKFIIDSEKLPPTCRNVINEKVSAALEFSPCESVYKDLISLVDDDKFSSIPMRSKDPEPRDKDITPKLSNFYRPNFAGEYFMIANPIVREPKNINTCSTFKISNKILIWKVCRDSDY